MTDADKKLQAIKKNSPRKPLVPILDEFDALEEEVTILFNQLGAPASDPFNPLDDVISFESLSVRKGVEKYI